jgi:alanine racemase
MDMSMLDITGVDAKVGDTVTIFGENPTISELAAILGTIPYEILTSVPRRIKRIIVK